jgi:hypothetical protein
MNNFEAEGKELDRQMILWLDYKYIPLSFINGTLPSIYLSDFDLREVTFDIHFKLILDSSLER